MTDDPTSREAFDTLYTVLETLTRVAAPLIPLVSERVWQGLTGGRSVHLQDWPDADAFPAADDIRSAMDAVREVSSVANALRKREGKRVRLPLARLTVVVPDAAALWRSSRTSSAMNSTSSPSSSSDLKDDTAAGVRHLAPTVGQCPRGGSAARQAGAAGDPGAREQGTGPRPMVSSPPERSRSSPGSTSSCSKPPVDRKARRSPCCRAAGSCCWTPRRTPELEAEGLARDVIRAVQDTRKAAGFDVSDRIRLNLTFHSGDDGGRGRLRVRDRRCGRRDPRHRVRRDGCRGRDPGREQPRRLEVRTPHPIIRLSSRRAPSRTPATSRSP